jgi:membrane protease YdiL (CAAX protease family)
MKINDIAQSLNTNPQNIKKALLLCFYVNGIVFVAAFFLSLFNLSFGLVPQIVYLVTVLVVAMKIDKDELRRIFVWRDIPVSVFAGAMVMFFGLEIIKSELNNLFQIAVPVPRGFFNNWFYEPENIFLTIIATALLPGFTEEVFFRGIIARRFYKTYSPCKAILLSAALFGIMHMNPWQAINAFYAGIFLGWIYLRCKSIWLCIFIHAYHNVLSSFMSFPYIKIENSSYLDIWRHPLWFDMLGLLLFGFGLLTVIVTLRENQRGKTQRVYAISG